MPHRFGPFTTVALEYEIWPAVAYPNLVRPRHNKVLGGFITNQFLDPNSFLPGSILRLSATVSQDKLSLEQAYSKIHLKGPIFNGFKT